jgi:hypothetical protein
MCSSIPYSDKLECLSVSVTSILVQIWNSTFYIFSLIIEGATEKVSPFILPIKLI